MYKLFFGVIRRMSNAYVQYIDTSLVVLPVPSLIIILTNDYIARQMCIGGITGFDYVFYLCYIENLTKQIFFVYKLSQNSGPQFSL